MKEKIIYFLLGAISIIFLFLIINSAEVNSDIGRYQISASADSLKVWVLDTKTGDIKKFNDKGKIDGIKFNFND